MVTLATVKLWGKPVGVVVWDERQHRARSEHRFRVDARMWKLHGAFRAIHLAHDHAHALAFADDARQLGLRMMHERRRHLLVRRRQRCPGSKVSTRRAR